MKQKMLFLMAALMTVLIYSCKKDNNLEPLPPPTTSAAATAYLNFSQLKVGNYWVYEKFNIDAAGNATSLNTFDSCYVEKDTIINSKIYLKVVKPMPYFPGSYDISFQRDSLHYIVNSNGRILFSYQDFSTIFATEYTLTGSTDTVCQIITQMADQNLTVTTPAGTFSTSNAKEFYSMYPGWTSAGNPRYRNTRYARNIGTVIETLPFFASSPNYTERRLARFHLN